MVISGPSGSGIGFIQGIKYSRVISKRTLVFVKQAVELTGGWAR